MQKRFMKYISVATLTLGTVVALSQNNTVSASEGAVVRISGETRYQTATNISQSGFEKSDTVFIANAMNFADALAGGPLAYQNEAPILLANGGSLRPDTLKEIKRLGAKKAVILGGEAAVSKSIDSELKKLGLSTERLAGETRFETAEIIADQLNKKATSTKAVVVDGYNFADAMSIAPFAAKEGMPIYLTRPSALPNEAALKSYSETFIVGGETVVSKDVENKLKKPTRLSGINRYQTNIEVLKYFDIDSNNLFVATGKDFADALTGSGLAALNQTGVALVRESGQKTLTDYLNTKSFNQYTILGGEVAVPKTVQDRLADFVKPVDKNDNSTEIPTPEPSPVITTKTETMKEAIPYKTVEEKTDTLPVGKTEVKTKGVTGEKEKVYTVTYTDGKETSRKLVSESTKIQPINEVVLIGTNTDPDVADRNPETGAYAYYPWVRKSDGREISMPNFDYRESDIDGLIKFIKEIDKYGIISYGFEENYTKTHIGLININPSFRRREKQFNITFSDPEQPGRSLVVGPYTEQYNELVTYFDGSQDVMPQYGLRAGDQLRYDDFGHRILYLQPISGRTMID